MAGIQERRKVLLVGDVQVGKTELYRRFMQNKFQDKYESTIGMDFNFYDKPLAFSKLQLWDTTGLTRFRTIISSQFKSADVIFICVDAHQPEQEIIRQIRDWQQQIQSQQPQAKIAIVMTQADVLEGQEGKDAVVAKQQRLAAALQVDPTEIVVCSAKTGEGLEPNGIFANFLENYFYQIDAVREQERQQVEQDVSEGGTRYDAWKSSVTNDAVKRMLTELKEQLDKYKNHLEAAYQKHKQHNASTNLPDTLAQYAKEQSVSDNATDNLSVLVQKQKVVNTLEQHLKTATDEVALGSAKQFQALNEFSKTLQEEAQTLETRRAPFRNHTKQSLINLAKGLAIGGIGIGLLAAMLVAKIATGRAYFWRTSGSDTAEDMQESLKKGRITPRGSSH